MSRENEKQKSGNAFINALKKSNMTAMAAILVVMIIIASIVSPYFLNVYNLQSVLRDLAFVGMIGIAQSLLLLVGELDLSVGKIACLSGILTGMLMVNVESMAVPCNRTNSWIIVRIYQWYYYYKASFEFNGCYNRYAGCIWWY